MSLILRNVEVAQGAFHFGPIDWEVPSGSYVVLRGANGNGKTTLLEAILGLRPLVRGSISWKGRDLTNLPIAERDIGYLPQDVVLFDHLSVRENLRFGTRFRERKTPPDRCETVAHALDLTPLLNRSVMTLSGGEKQRVALGRVLAWVPEFILLDEPFAAMDEKSRETCRMLLQFRHAKAGTTILHVSHDAADRQVEGSMHFQVTPTAVTPAPPG